MVAMSMRVARMRKYDREGENEEQEDRNEDAPKRNGAKTSQSLI